MIVRLLRVRIYFVFLLFAGYNYAQQIDRSITTLSTSFSAYSCDLQGRDDQTGSTTFTANGGVVVSLACSSLIALDKSALAAESRSTNSTISSSGLPNTKPASPTSSLASPILSSPMHTSTSTYSCDVNGPTDQTGTTTFTAFGGDLITLACSSLIAIDRSAFFANHPATANISQATITQAPQYIRPSQDPSAVCNIYGPVEQPGSIIVGVNLTTTVSTTTVACSAYLEYQSSSVGGNCGDQTYRAEFGRSPECTSYVDEKLSYRPKGCAPTASFTENPQTYCNAPCVVNAQVGAMQYRCCGNCQAHVDRVSIMYFPTASANTGCSPASGTITSSASLPSNTGSLNARAINPVGNGSTVALDGFTFTSPSVYLAIDGTIGVSDSCGQRGPVRTNAIVPLSSNYLTTISYSSWPSDCGQRGEAQRPDEAITGTFFESEFGCPTWGFSNEFMTTCDGSVYLTKTVGPPYNPLILLPSEILAVDPSWNKCSDIESEGNFIITYGVYDPPRTLTVAEGLTPAASPTEVPAEPVEQMAKPVNSNPPKIPIPTAQPPAGTKPKPKPSLDISRLLQGDPQNSDEFGSPAPKGQKNSGGTSKANKGGSPSEAAPGEDSKEPPENPGISLGSNPEDNLSEKPGSIVESKPGGKAGGKAGGSSGSSSGRNPGNNPVSKSGSSSGGNQESSSGSDPGSNSESNSGSNLGNNPGNNPGSNSGNKLGSSPASDSGNTPGSNPGSNSGSNSGSSSGGNQGSSSGSNSGGNPGNKLGSSPASGSGNIPGSNPGSNSGSNSGSKLGGSSGSSSGSNTEETPGNNSGTSKGDQGNGAATGEESPNTNSQGDAENPGTGLGRLIMSALGRNPGPNIPTSSRQTIQLENPGENIPPTFSIAGKIVSQGGPAITVAGTKVSLGPSGLVVGSSTISLGNLVPQVTNVAGQMITIQNPSVSVGASILTPGGDSVTSSPIVLLGSSGQSVIGGDGLSSLSQSVFTIADQTFTANPIAFPIAGTTLSAGGPAITISGTPVSLASSGNLVVGGNSPSSPTSVFTLGDQTFTANPTAVVFSGTTLSVGGPAATVAGTRVSLGANNNLILGSSTIQLAASTAFTAGDQPFTPNPTGFSIDGTTIAPGGSGIMIDGTKISLGPSGDLVVGSKTVALAEPTPGTTYTLPFEGGQTRLREPEAKVFVIMSGIGLALSWWW